jgi:hypothetical protein
MTMLQGSMTRILSRFSDLSDAALLAEVRTLSIRERQVTAQLIASLAELDARRLYLGESCSSLFTYCTQVLHLSEHAAYGRIEAARAAKRFPVILDRLADGSITLTAVCLLSPHLTIENHAALLDAARHKSKREVEHMVARIRPLPPIESSVRKLPAPLAIASAPAHDVLSAGAPEVKHTHGASSSLPPKPAVMAPVAPEQYKVQMTVSRETYEKLRRAQELIRHTIPNADPATIFDRALTLLVTELEKTKFAATIRPRAARETAAGSRHIPVTVKREVWARDGGQCAFIGTHGRCSERGFLEFHHVVPYADGGEPSAGNLQLRCRAHNAYEAEQHFGPLLTRERRATWEPGPDRVACSQSAAESKS